MISNKSEFKIKLKVFTVDIQIKGSGLRIFNSKAQLGSRISGMFIQENTGHKNKQQKMFPIFYFCFSFPSDWFLEAPREISNTKVVKTSLLYKDRFLIFFSRNS